MKIKFKTKEQLLATRGVAYNKVRACWDGPKSGSVQDSHALPLLGKSFSVQGYDSSDDRLPVAISHPNYGRYWVPYWLIMPGSVAMIKAIGPNKELTIPGHSAAELDPFDNTFSFPCEFSGLTVAEARKVAKWVLRVTARRKRSRK